DLRSCDGNACTCGHCRTSTGRSPGAARPGAGRRCAYASSVRGASDERFEAPDGLSVPEDRVAEVGWVDVEPEACEQERGHEHDRPARAVGDLAGDGATVGRGC